MRFLLKNLEEIIASIAITITVLVVIVNVFLRYGFGFVVPWSEELSVVCFIWAVYLGISSCYKHKLHMGVDILVNFLPDRLKNPFSLVIAIFLLALNLLMAKLSIDYLMFSNKTSPVMGLSYFYVNGALTLSFCLMTIHSIKFIVDEIMTLRQMRKTTNQ